MTYFTRNLADDVYDAVFRKLTVTTNTGDNEQVLFTTEFTGRDKLLFQLNEIWESIIFWFLRNV